VRRRLISALAGGALLALASAGAAPARPVDPVRSSIAHGARLSASAKSVQLGGVVRCPTCRGFTLGATVSQTSSGAVGQGGVRCVCHGPRTHWLLTARTREATTFKPGAARVCVWVIARGAGNKAIDAEQWCEPVRLSFAAT